MTVQPNETGVEAACTAARKAIQNYSQFDSSMVPDDALRTVILASIEAYLTATQKGK